MAVEAGYDNDVYVECRGKKASSMTSMVLSVIGMDGVGSLRYGRTMMQTCFMLL